MLGDIAHQSMGVVERRSVSKKFKEALLQGWVEPRAVSVPTLVRQKEAWRELWLYASGTNTWCPRKYALMAVHGVKTATVKPETQYLFDTGTAYHTMFQGGMLQGLKSARLLGSWQRTMWGAEERAGWGVHGGVRDVVGDEEPISVLKGVVPCPEGTGWKYVEPKFRTLDTRIVVKLDGILEWDDDEDLEIVEIKTEKMAAREILDPFYGGWARSKHIEQVMIGMYATGIRRARIIYVFKDAPSLSSSILEVVIHYDEEIVNDLLTKAKRCVSAIRMIDKMKVTDDFDPEDGCIPNIDVWFDNTLPRPTECALKSKGPALYCDAREPCFPKGYRKKKQPKKD